MPITKKKKITTVTTTKIILKGSLVYTDITYSTGDLGSKLGFLNLKS